MKQPFSTHPSYRHYILSLHRLHALFVANQDETLEADAVRDSMDGPWYELSDAERDRISGLSGDLYSISDPLQPTLPMTPEARARLAKAIEAREAGEWDEALSILRQWGRYVEPALLSYLRGTVWKGAGDDTTATLFFEHAARLEPEIESLARLDLDGWRKSDIVSGTTDSDKPEDSQGVQ